MVPLVRVIDLLSRGHMAVRVESGQMVEWSSRVSHRVARRSNPTKRVPSLLLGCVVLAVPAALGQTRFSFAPHLDLNAPAHTLGVANAVVEGRKVQILGGDSAQPTKPFIFDWGDGQTTESWFPAEHEYTRGNRKYVVKITARYPDRTDTISVDVRLPRPRYSYKRDRRVPRRVFVPKEPVTLGSTMPGYTTAADITSFSNAELSTVPRDVIEYVLDVGHHIQMDMCNGDVTELAATRQVVLKQTSFGGCGALWFTDPVAFICHPNYLAGEVGFSSLLHELAHNLTLNSPANYRFGGKTDGPANTIVSETLAQIFQHATIYEILNTKGHYGLSSDVCTNLRESGIKSIGVVREAHRKYLADPSQCTTYNDPATPHDDTFNTFVTVAYVFCEMAEQRRDYRTPLKRMMRLMQTFSPADHERYRQRENEPFRATFLIAAMSFGFDTDLREKFRGLKFPISDEIYTEFLTRMN